MCFQLGSTCPGPPHGDNGGEHTSNGRDQTDDDCPDDGPEVGFNTATRSPATGVAAGTDRDSMHRSNSPRLSQVIRFIPIAPGDINSGLMGGPPSLTLRAVITNPTEIVRVAPTPSQAPIRSGRWCGGGDDDDSMALIVQHCPVVMRVLFAFSFLLSLVPVPLQMPAADQPISIINGYLPIKATFSDEVSFFLLGALQLPSRTRHFGQALAFTFLSSGFGCIVRFGMPQEGRQTVGTAVIPSRAKGELVSGGADSNSRVDT